MRRGWPQVPELAFEVADDPRAEASRMLEPSRGCGWARPGAQSRSQPIRPSGWIAILLLDPDGACCQRPQAGGGEWALSD